MAVSIGQPPDKAEERRDRRPLQGSPGVRDQVGREHPPGKLPSPGSCYSAHVHQWRVPGEDEAQVQSRCRQA